MKKRTNREIEALLAQAVDKTLPDLMDQLASDPLQARGYYESLLPKEVRRPAPRRARRLILAGGLCLALLVGGGLSYFSPAAHIGIQVNPSMELTTNFMDRVIRVEALNQDAEVILEDLDLKHVKVDTAVSAIVGSFVQHEYFADGTGTIHITVTADDQRRAVQLEQKVTAQVETSLPKDNQVVIDTGHQPEPTPIRPHATANVVEEGTERRKWLDHILILAPGYPLEKLEGLSLQQLKELAWELVEELAEEEPEPDGQWDIPEPDDLDDQDDDDDLDDLDDDDDSDDLDDDDDLDDIDDDRDSDDPEDDSDEEDDD